MSVSPHPDRAFAKWWYWYEKYATAWGRREDQQQIHLQPQEVKALSQRRVEGEWFYHHDETCGIAEEEHSRSRARFLQKEKAQNEKVGSKVPHAVGSPSKITGARATNHTGATKQSRGEKRLAGGSASRSTPRGDQAMRVCEQVCWQSLGARTANPKWLG